MDTKKAGLLRLLPELKESWNSLAGRYAADEAQTARFFEEIRKKYTGRGRHYHNLYHITALLRLSRQYSHLLADKEVVDWAIFYHDIIYNVLRKDNEHRSALLAADRLAVLGVSRGKTDQVVLFIEATKTHQLPQGALNTADLQLFLDFDMSILAAPWSDYEAYTRQVRKEYRVYPDKLYIPGRRQFLQHCLQPAPVFHTALFRDRYEAAARENMRRELEAMSNGQ
jgi:predicted metal-dependent HD superfamily phosphohydrolase